MLRTIGWVTWLFFYLISRIPLYIRTGMLRRRGDKAAHDAIVHRQVQLWAGRLLHHLKVSLEVEGRENLPAPGEVVVFAANHQSLLDIPALLAALSPPVPLLARKEIGQVPMLGGWMRELGCLFVDRDNMRSSIEVMKQAEEMIRAGSPLIIFPEGTRGDSDSLSSFKAGVVRIAWRAGVRIVPVVIEGTWRCLEGNGFRVRPGKAHLRILPPVEAAGLSRAEQKELPGLLEGMFREAMGQ